MTPTETPVPKAKSGRFRRIRKILGFGLIALVALFFTLPLILSMGFVRSALEDSMADALGVEVTIEDHSVGWFSPVQMKGVRVEQPTGTQSDGPLFALEDASFELSLAEIAMGRVRLQGRVLRPELRVVQHVDGTTNLDELGKKDRDDGPNEEPDEQPDEQPDDEPSDDQDDDESLADKIRKHRMEFAIVDGFLDIHHDVHGLVEQLTDLNVRIEKPEDATKFTATLDAKVHRPTGDDGELAIRVEWDADPSHPMIARMDCDEFDLGRYEAVLRALLGERKVESFQGVVTAHTRIESKPGEALQSNGQIRIDQLRLAGELFSGLDIQAERFQFVPSLQARLDDQGKLTELDLAGLSFDLGVLRLDGLATETQDGRAMPGMHFVFDLDGLAQFGGPMPELLKGTGAQLEGSLRVPLAAMQGELEIWDLARMLDLDAAFGFDRLEIADQVIESVSTRLDLAGGRLQLRTEDGRFSGGGLNLSMDVDASDASSVPSFEGTVGVEGSRVVGRAAEGLCYVMPILSGLEEVAGFQSGLDCDLSLAGPLMPGDGEEMLSWLSRLTGNGELALGGGQFAPAGTLAQLAQVVGQQDGTRIAFESFRAALDLSEGFLTPSSMNLDCGEREFPLVGRTGVDGSLDYVIDVRDWLRGHRDGERLLQFLGDEPLGAQLGGSVDDPSLGLPSLDELLQRAATRALEEQGADALRRALGGSELEGVVDDVLGPILGGSRGGQGESGNQPQDVLEGVLRGVLGGNENQREPEPEPQGSSGGEEPPEGEPQGQRETPVDPLEILRRLRRGGR
ncbi:MAG: hypothetical protein AAF196_08655 [Planctomycetota bacterium]